MKIGLAPHRPCRTHREIVSLAAGMALVQLVAATVSWASPPTQTSEIAIPRTLGKIERRAQGSNRAPLILIIGEDHISEKTQISVARLLRYLTGAYDVTLVCTEGYDKPIGTSGAPTASDRTAATADFAARRISAVEYFARTIPGVKVAGVEDMKAYAAHGKSLSGADGLQEEATKWSTDFELFVKNDVLEMTGTEQQAERVASALKQLLSDHRFEPFAEVIYSIAGKNSTIGKKLTALDDRHRALESKAHDLVDDSTEMRARDTAMVAGTLRQTKDANVSAAILVVGTMHLPGVEAQLREAAASFVTVLPAGVEDEKDDKTTKDDAQRYEQLRKGSVTGLEEWFRNFKPLPAVSRDTARERNALLGALNVADRLGRQGMSEAEILQVVSKSQLPNGASIQHVFAVNNGEGIQFKVGNKTGYAYFVGSEEAAMVSGATPIEAGSSDGGYYAIYEGEGSGTPPIPPIRGGGGAGSSFSDDFRNRLRLMIPDQRKKQPQRVTIAFTVKDGRVVRTVDGGKVVALDVTPKRIESLRHAYEHAAPGPEKILAAQELGDAVLVELDSQFPEGRKELVVISENDILGDVSLRWVNEFAARSDAKRLAEIDPARVFVARWDEAKKSLDGLERDAPKEKAEERTRAVEEIREQTKGKSVKEMMASSGGNVDVAKLAKSEAVVSHAVALPQSS